MVTTRVAYGRATGIKDAAMPYWDAAQFFPNYSGEDERFGLHVPLGGSFIEKEPHEKNRRYMVATGIPKTPLDARSDAKQFFPATVVAMR